MKQALLIVTFFLGITSVYSQEHATCDDAIKLTSSSYGPVIAEGWADSSLCVPNDENMYFGKSHKVVWFSFVVPYDTTLTFDVLPVNAADDFDFMLFKADKSDFCRQEKQRKIKPVRTNFAKPTKYNKGITGLSEKATEAMVAPGFNSPYSSALNAKKGERYYLAVDNYVDTKGGFTLKFHLRFDAKTTKSHIDTTLVKAPSIGPVSHANFFIHVRDSANRPIKAALTLTGVLPDKAISVDTANYSLQLEKYQTINIRVNAPGHMPYQSSYSTTGDTSSATFFVHLQPIKTAQKITLRDIQFGENSPIILPVSKPALDYVLQFLLNNPNVKVIIKGYTNDPDNSQAQNYDQILSEKRANAVKNYFAARGIDKKRMQCIGYGSSQMVYRYPTNKEQQAANRRVEIEIQ